MPAERILDQPLVHYPPKVQPVMHEVCAECEAELHKVPAPGTSQRCSACGFTTPGSRGSQAFVCKNPDCGWSDNTDRNAARNILHLYRTGLARIPAAGGQSSGVLVASNPPPQGRQESPALTGEETSSDDERRQHRRTDLVLNVHAYQKAFAVSQYSLGSAIGVVMLVILLAVMLVYLRLLGRQGEEL